MALIKKICVLGIVLLLVSGCRKSTSANWDVDVSLPVVNSKLNITNYAGDTLFKTDNTGLLYLRLNREVASIKLDSILNIPNKDTTLGFVTIFPLNLKPGDVITSQAPSELPFTMDYGIAIKRADIRKAVLSIKFTNTVSQPVQLIYKIPNATKNGAPFIISEVVPTGTNTLMKDYDLSGYSLNMRGLSGNVYNTLVQSYSLTLAPNSPSVFVNPGEGASIQITYSKIVPDYVEGYFGQQTVKIDLDTAKFGIIENFKASNFMLSDATMNFSILNEFGAEFSASLSNIKSIYSVGSRIIPLNTNQLSNLNINSATRVGNTIYPSIRSFSFTGSNSNITAFISNIPDKLTYQGQVKVNPLGNVNGYNDFAYYNTGLRVLADVSIPLRFTADYFELNSEASVNFTNVEQLDKVNYGNFVISSSNGFPFSAILQGYMYNAENKLIDSLFVPGTNIILAGNLNAQNEVISPRVSKVYVPVNQTKITNLRECKKLKIVSKFIMPPNPPEIKLLEKYEIDINIIAELNYKVGLNNK
jgi:hypothetical protein